MTPKNKFKKVMRIYHSQYNSMTSGGMEVDIYGLFRYACGVDDEYIRPKDYLYDR